MSSGKLFHYIEYFRSLSKQIKADAGELKISRTLLCDYSNNSNHSNSKKILVNVVVRN